MMGQQSIILIIVAFQVACGGFCAWLAKDKGRQGFDWFFNGLCFGLIGLIAIAAASNTKELQLLENILKELRADKHPERN